MPYTPTPWVDDVTLVNAARMNNLESGVDQAHDAWRTVFVDRLTSTAAPTSMTSLVWENERYDDWAGYAPGSPTQIVIVQTMAVLVGCNLFFTGASGSGSVQARIVHQNAAGATLAIVAQADGSMNNALNLVSFVDCAATDKFVVQASTGATGTAHSWTGRFWIRQAKMI